MCNVTYAAYSAKPRNRLRAHSCRAGFDRRGHERASVASVFGTHLSV